MRGDERVGDERDDKRGRGVQEKSKVKKKTHETKKNNYCDAKTQKMVKER